MALLAGRVTISILALLATVSKSSTGTSCRISTCPVAIAAKRVDGSVIGVISAFLIEGASPQ